MSSAGFGDVLATVNACLNGTSTVCLLLGFIAVKNKRIKLHKWSMISAFTASTVFLIGYLIRFYLTGAHRFPDVGLWRTVYLIILFSHMILALAAVPLVVRTLFLAYKKRFDEHRRIAKYTYPIWLYVSVTGVIVYLMLYQLAPTLV